MPTVIALPNNVTTTKKTMKMITIMTLTKNAPIPFVIFQFHLPTCTLSHCWIRRLIQNFHHQPTYTDGAVLFKYKFNSEMNNTCTHLFDIQYHY